MASLPLKRALANLDAARKIQQELEDPYNSTREVRRDSEDPYGSRREIRQEPEDPYRVALERERAIVRRIAVEMPAERPGRRCLWCERPAGVGRCCADCAAADRAGVL